MTQNHAKPALVEDVVMAQIQARGFGFVDLDLNLWDSRCNDQ